MRVLFFTHLPLKNVKERWFGPNTPWGHTERESLIKDLVFYFPFLYSIPMPCCCREVWSACCTEPWQAWFPRTSSCCYCCWASPVHPGFNIFRIHALRVTTFWNITIYLWCQKKISILDTVLQTSSEVFYMKSNIVNKSIGNYRILICLPVFGSRCKVP